MNKQYRLTRILGFTGMTYLLQTFRYYCLFHCATLSQVLEFVCTDCIYLPFHAKNGIALLHAFLNYQYVRVYFTLQ